MAKIAIALGSNLDNPHKQLKTAKSFLERISESTIENSHIYESEPIGPSEFNFLNAVILIESKLAVDTLFQLLKEQEKRQGRPSRYPKWTARSIDMDIISYDDKILKTDELTIPHLQYSQRLFVLLPLQDVLPDWVDPESKKSIKELIEVAPNMIIHKSNVGW